MISSGRRALSLASVDGEEKKGKAFVYLVTARFVQNIIHIAMSIVHRFEHSWECSPWAVPAAVES